MIVHIADMIKKGIRNIKIRTVDTNIIVILLGYMPEFLELNKCTKIWADFGTANYRRLISINESYETLGESFSLAMIFFH